MSEVTMDYQRIYSSLIAYRKRVPLEKNSMLYTEMHHILPRCMGGQDTDENCVRLTAKEHIFVHHLLYRMHKNTPYENKMGLAWGLMVRINKKTVSSGIAAKAREASAKACRGENNPMWGKPGTNLGRVFSKEHREKLSQSKRGENHPFFNKPSPNLGRSLSAQTKEKLRKANLGKTQTPETIAKRIASRLSKERGKLLDSQRREIHLLFATGEYTKRHLAEKFGVSFSAIKHLLKNKRYAPQQSGIK